MDILLVEDDSMISEMEKKLLEKHGYKVKCAYSGTEALLILERESFNLMLLDLMLPGITGEEVIDKVRKINKLPIICISAKDDLSTRLNCMRNGADDFLVKPFNNEELLVRTEALLRRTSISTEGELSEEEKADRDILKYKDIILNKSDYAVTVSGKDAGLTKKEFLILKLFMENPKKVFTKENIFESVWNEIYMPEDNAVNVHVSNLRSKIAKINPEEYYIKTVWSIGFKLAD